MTYPILNLFFLFFNKIIKKLKSFAYLQKCNSYARIINYFSVIFLGNNFIKIILTPSAECSDPGKISSLRK